jgi:hypothetical protein
MSDLRHIHDPVLSSLKMESVRLLFLFPFYFLLFAPWCVSFFLEAFKELRTATFNFVMFVRPSVRMRNLGFHRTDFHKISVFFESLSSLSFVKIGDE